MINGCVSGSKSYQSSRLHCWLVINLKPNHWAFYWPKDQRHRGFNRIDSVLMLQSMKLRGIEINHQINYWFLNSTRSVLGMSYDIIIEKSEADNHYYAVADTHTCVCTFFIVLFLLDITFLIRQHEQFPMSYVVSS